MFQLINVVNRKFFTLLVLIVLLFSQVGFVSATGGAMPDGGFCEAGGDCKNACCCCGIAVGTNGPCVSPKDGVCGSASCNNVVCPLSSHRNLYSLATTVADYMFYLGIILAPLMIVIGGFLFMASGGSPERAQLGKKIITWAVIGLVFILFAKGVSSIIGDILFGGG